MQNDLTTGSVFRNVVSFSLPYLLSYFLQTLYGMADLFIIGQFEGVASTTAVSIGSQVMHMLTVMLVGLAMGATVSIAQAAGGGDKKRTASAIGNTVTLFMLLSLALTALLLALRGGIVSIMSTPEEAVQGTLAYLTVCFIGIPFITAYNIIASIFRGLGDSKSPMYFIAVACVVNIALDYYFMGTLHLGPAGAALGTTLSQAVSVLVSLAIILKRRLISVRRADFRPQRAVMGKLLQIGVPVALQDGFIQVSFVIITIIANRRGLTDAAAVGIVEKIIGFLFLIPSSMLSTVSALGAQNIGAGKPERARLTLRYAAMIACSFGIAVVILTLFIAEPLGEITLIHSPALRLFWIDTALTAPDYSALELSTSRLAAAQAEALVFLGKVGFSVSQEHLNVGSFGQYDGEFLVLDEADRFAGDVIDLPASLCARVRFRGHHAESPAQYRRLMQFIREEGYTAAGFSREITVIDYGFTPDTEKFVTEIMIPLQKV
ncbi:MAG TPA: MATE family efflux transporter [Clostridiales bacterium]|mgnify:CR=1 FL=1|jgi:MATE efflux family protein|nr:MATE family efflux transporter [Clostridiales bacterium]